jgi:hypothetical protein
MPIVDDKTFEVHKGHRILSGAMLEGDYFCDTCGVYLEVVR